MWPWRLAALIPPHWLVSLVEDHHLWANGWQTPARRVRTRRNGERDPRLPIEDPVTARAFVELDLEFERVAGPRVDVGGHVEAAAVPRLLRIVRDVVVVADGLPAGNAFEDRRLVLLKSGDFNVVVVAGLAAQPGIDRPAPAKEPIGAER